MCSFAAPDDSASAFVIASMILGTDSSVTLASYSFTSTHGMSGSSFVPWLCIPAPAVRVVALDDHPRVLLELRCFEHLEQRLRHPLDQPRFELWRQAPFEQLHAHERHG